ncbi:GTP pyrophosphokinase [Nocardioides taihuensis]|uniref:GTP pyrophosphokinase family protein n=1 Tax=Nocardioides taihuensis TaxID=1835606 RepID=A0ABW0BRH5_9ACTN
MGTTETPGVTGTALVGCGAAKGATVVAQASGPGVSDPSSDKSPSEASPDWLGGVSAQSRLFLLEYEFGLREVETKIAILRDEFLHMHDYNPIEHVTSRVKSPESIRAKVERRGLEHTLDSVRSNITDIAGVRVTCSFVTDSYRIFELLTAQDDITTLKVSDYIAEPKANGYKSLHAIIEIPVFLSSGPVSVPVELQLRSIAMDFWASLEHKIYYKYDGEVPDSLLRELKEAAESANELDSRMERLHRELHG